MAGCNSAFIELKTFSIFSPVTWAAEVAKLIEHLTNDCEVEGLNPAAILEQDKRE